MMKLCIVAGARPNFMKIAPIIEAINVHNQRNNKSVSHIDHALVHTGQHYDKRMSELFFSDLGIPEPNINLEVGSGSHAEQTAEIMKRFEKICLEKKPTHALVVGDVNSTIACALVASKLGIKVIHVEAGLRSFDRTMPEEINRVLTDSISDLLFITEESAEHNLIREGISKNKIHFVGNVMIDTLLKHKRRAEQTNILYNLGLVNSNPNDESANSDSFDKNRVAYSERATIQYAVLTLHRPSNVDNQEIFRGIIEALTEISTHIPIIFPVHPRTLKQFKKYGYEGRLKWLSSDKSPMSDNGKGIYCLEPLGYLDFLQLMANSQLVLTDSGGIQEETTILSIPCVTIRENTERPSTVKYGTNKVVGTARSSIIKASLEALNGNLEKRSIPPLWDGRAAERIVSILAKEMHKRA